MPARQRARSIRTSHLIETESIPKRFSRYSRFSRFSVRLDESFNIRKSLADYVKDELENQDRALFYQRVFIFGKTNPNFTPPPDMDFKLALQCQIYRILNAGIDQSFTTDLYTGMFICMGDFSIILVECTEDMVGQFCIELCKIADEYFAATRVFLIEDKTGEPLFDSFVYRRAAAVNTTEKFPAATPNDEELMAEQHRLIVKKLHKVCKLLKKRINMSVTRSAQNLYRSVHSIPDLQVSPEQFNKILPEVQRLDLVFASKRFYRNLKDYVQVYKTIPSLVNEDAQIWPIPFGYMPANVFQRLQYDVNLTFGDYYGKKDAKADEAKEGSDDDEEDKKDEDKKEEEEGKEEGK